MTVDPRDFLSEMAHESATRTRTGQSQLTESQLRRRIAMSEPPPPLKLNGFDVMAEVKLRSPSAGLLMRQPATPLGEVWSRARAYGRGGAAAISVLTQPTRFDGALAQLSTAARAVPNIPVMRKDFLVDPYQVLEARAAGAGGVLLIVRLVDDATLDALLAETRAQGMFALIEAFDGADLARANRRVVDLPPGPPVLIGVNTRDLATLAIDRQRLADLAKDLPSQAIGVAESGLATPADAEAAARMGYRIALVGTALMDAPHPARLIGEMLTAGRAVCA